MQAKHIIGVLTFNSFQGPRGKPGPKGEKGEQGVNVSCLIRS